MEPLSSATRVSRHRWRRLRSVPAGVVTLIMILALDTAPVQAQAEETAVSNEYQIKAAFLLNFLKFIEWPSAVLPRNDSPITIGILGQDPFGSALPDTLRDENVRGHPLSLRRSSDINDLRACQLIFISKSEAPREGQIITSISELPILTVSDNAGFCREGGVIQLYLEDKKVRFMINQPGALNLGLKVSSQLLNVAKVFGHPDGSR